MAGSINPEPLDPARNKNLGKIFDKAPELVSLLPEMENTPPTLLQESLPYDM
jgi:hypothetical protein